MASEKDVQRAKENVMKGEGYLHIKRLPKNTVGELINFLNNDDEFGGDWAMGIKHIWDTYKGIMAPKDEQITNELELLHHRIDQLEKEFRNPSVKENKGLKMADGKLR